jgi:hypothetical protein
LHPDDFLLAQLDLYQDAALCAFRDCRANMVRDPVAADEYADMLERHLLPKTADRLRCLIDAI